MGELYSIETRKKAGQVLEDHSKTICKASNTKATTTWWERVTISAPWYYEWHRITKGDEFDYLLQSRTVQNVKMKYLRHLLEMLCLIFGNASICRIWDHYERRNRTRSKPGKDFWQTWEVWQSRKKPRKGLSDPTKPGFQGIPELSDPFVRRFSILFHKTRPHK